MPRATLQDPAQTFHVDLDVSMRVDAKPGTQSFEFENDVMRDIGYRGPSIGFGGNGIKFTARGMIYGNSSPDVSVEISFVQTLTASVARGAYKDGHAVERYQPELPVRDGSDTDIWYKSDSVQRYSPQQMAALARFGRMNGLRFEIEAKDKVKSSFPVNFPRTGTGQLPISGFTLRRTFLTCVAVRVIRRRVRHVFYLDRVKWTCGYGGKRGIDGAWDPAPAATPFYQVGSVEPAAAPFLAPPPNLRLDGPVANQAEQIRKS